MRREFLKKEILNAVTRGGNGCQHNLTLYVIDLMLVVICKTFINAAAGNATQVMSIASGPCAEIVDWFQVLVSRSFTAYLLHVAGLLLHLPRHCVCSLCLQDKCNEARHDVHFWCLDNDAASLAFARHR